MPSPSSTDDQFGTNTLVLTGLTREFFRLDVLEELRNLFASYGEINQWAKVSTLGRIIIVYVSEEHAMRAKNGCVGLIRCVFGDQYVFVRPPLRLIAALLIDHLSLNIGLYAIEPNPLRYGSEIPETNFLKVPDLEKNFLISPPGSPPAGWEPIKEDPPNATPLADDLIAALKKLQIRRDSIGFEIVLDPDEGSGISICVQNCCDDVLDHVETEWAYGQRTPSYKQWQPTALPPLHGCAF